MDGWMNRWMDGWMNGWMGRMGIHNSGQNDGRFIAFTSFGVLFR
jgi:hypothetical protein